MRKRKKPGNKKRKRPEVPYIYEVKVGKYERRMKLIERKEKRRIGKLLQKLMR